jgi:type II secretory pathway pseudopilin PulG
MHTILRQQHLRTRRAGEDRSGGYVLVDAIMALAIVLILLGVLTVAVSRQRRGSERLADSRAAIRLAEETITAMQTGGTPPTAPQGTKIELHATPTPAGLEVPSGSTWVDVRVTYGNGRSSSLSGLVRADAAKGAVK